MTTITTSMPIDEIARTAPATIKVFQRHQIDFCCTGGLRLSEACASRGLDAAALVTELQTAMETAPGDEAESLAEQPLHVIIRHIQTRYHEPLRLELTRLDAMLSRVLDRHGERLPDVLPALHGTFAGLRTELLDHMSREDQILFPAIAALEAGSPTPFTPELLADGPIPMMEQDHDSALEAFRVMRRLTRGYAPPEWACPTFRGLYYGLSELEREMVRHIALENEVLFPRAASLK